METKLYYEIGENEYWIKDENDPLFLIHQYEPYTHLYVPEGTLEDNAAAQLTELTAPVEEKITLTDEQRDAVVDEILGGIENGID